MKGGERKEGKRDRKESEGLVTLCRYDDGHKMLLVHSAFCVRDEKNTILKTKQLISSL